MIPDEELGKRVRLGIDSDEEDERIEARFCLAELQERLVDALAREQHLRSNQRAAIHRRQARS